MDEELQIGEVLKTDGREYTVIQFLGRGSSFTAYLAECKCGGFITKCILKQSRSVTDAWRDENDLNAQSHYLRTAQTQHHIRQIAHLMNQTPPVNNTFEVNGKGFIDVAAYNGNTLDKLPNLTLPQYMEICLAAAKTVRYYHEAGFLCLDLKPENIFILQNAPDDTITQLVAFIDFTSVSPAGESGLNPPSYTKAWAAPEQINPYSAGKIGAAAEIYTLGEIVFWLLFGRHSTEQEHRGFSKYPFDEVKRTYHPFTDRPDIQALFTRLFRSTIRSAASNRFQNMQDVEKLLASLCDELNKKDYVIPKLPAVSPYFVGRDAEMKAIAAHLKRNPVLYVTGIGGIGKSTLIRNYLYRMKSEYDVIVYLEYDGDFKRTFCDDLQLQISTISRFSSESPDDYFYRKLSYLRNICTEKRVLFVLDNFSGRITKDLSRVIDCGYDTVIVTRNQPPKNSFACIEIGAITNIAELFRLIVLNLERPLTKDERAAFSEIINLVQGHTLVIELIARQIAAGKLVVQMALALIRENGFSRFSQEKIGNYKDGEEVCDTLSAIISALFDAGGMSPQERLTMQVLSLLDVRGLHADLIRDIVHLDLRCVPDLNMQGWLSADSVIRMHPVIAETVRGWQWTADEIAVMNYHQKMIDIYAGMANAAHIRGIVREAERYCAAHPQHLVKAMYYDMVGWYEDVLTGGCYVPQNAGEAEQFLRHIETAENAIREAGLSDAPESTHYLAKYCLSLASILIRSMYAEYIQYAADLMIRARDLIDKHEPAYSENRCFLCMVTAWYFTLCKPDCAQTKLYTEKAAAIAAQVFLTELEIIDIIHIPTANCWLYHDDLQTAAEKLEEAVTICKKYPDLLPYIDKQADLLNCLLDVYAALQDYAKCRELIAEIDRINETYRDQGIFREIPPEIRKKTA
ncbi:MAG TPA: serine/threonine protein kinase [Ruminococcus sp.]|nr:serine/threonine protein kinase [Ruminococcus sp.]